MESPSHEHNLPGIVRDALSRVEGLLDVLFDTAEDAILLLDGMRCVDCNPATLRMFGRSPKNSIIGESPSLFSPVRQPDGSLSADSARRVFDAAMDGVPQHFEWRHCRLDHSEFDVEMRLNRIQVGDVPFLVAVVRDITARKRTEEAARISMSERKRAADKLLQEKQFSERLIDSLPGSFYLFDSNLRLRRWNKNVEESSGYTAAELSGRSMGDFFGSGADSQRVIAAARDVLCGNAIDFVEVEVLRKDGSLAPYVLSGAHVDSPDGPMLLGLGINIANRRRAEQALAASERNYREVFDATNDALVIHDEKGHVLDANDRARTVFGFDAERARLLSINDLSLGEPPYSQCEACEKIRLAVHEGPQVFDWRSRRVDGTLFWSEVALRAFQSEGAQRIIASVRDVTERKVAALERERLMEELQAASSAKDQFLAVLSHELRNPLAAIQAGVDLLRHRSGDDDPRLLRAVDVVERNVKLQARLVDDLLDLSRHARGKLTIERVPLELDEVVLSAVQECRADAARAEVSLETHTSPGIWIEADGDRIRQVVINLVSNGIKFTHKGGEVAISVTAKDRQGQIIVEDNGSGIEPDRLSNLFEMFQQGQVAARRAPGLGIGLALVKSIAELHGGRVWAESEGPGRGSRFTVELPRCEAPKARGVQKIPSPEPAPIKMLLVEDNGDTRTLLAETFTELAYQVVPAESAEAALDILAGEAADVIVADIGLPGMDGYEFLRRARRLPTAAHTPAFALTGYGREKDIRQAHDAGYTDHITKPIDVAAIDRRIRSRVPQARH